MYAKLVNGYLRKPDKQILLDDGRIVTNPTAEVLEEFGFKEVLETPRPQEEEGYYYTSHYEDDGNYIVKVWEKHESVAPETPIENDPIPADETDEVLKILYGKE